MATTIFAEDVPYFKTSTIAADSWVAKAKREIASVGGKVTSEMFGSDITGKVAFMIWFAIGAEQFKLTWPVLPCRKGNETAARIQAATALYHDVKARVVSAKFLGTRGAFFNYLVLENGRTASEVGATEFLALVPSMLLGTGR